MLAPTTVWKLTTTTRPVYQLYVSSCVIAGVDHILVSACCPQQIECIHVKMLQIGMPGLFYKMSMLNLFFMQFLRNYSR